MSDNHVTFLMCYFFKKKKQTPLQTIVSLQPPSSPHSFPSPTPPLFPSFFPLSIKRPQAQHHHHILCLPIATIAISPLESPLCSRYLQPSCIVNSYWLARNCFIAVNHSSVMLPFLLIDHVSVTQLPSAPCTNSTINHHIVASYFHHCRIAILLSSLHRSATICLRHLRV